MKDSALITMLTIVLLFVIVAPEVQANKADIAPINTEIIHKIGSGIYGETSSANWGYVGFKDVSNDYQDMTYRVVVWYDIGGDFSGNPEYDFCAIDRVYFNWTAYENSNDNSNFNGGRLYDIPRWPTSDGDLMDIGVWVNDMSYQDKYTWLSGTRNEQNLLCIGVDPLGGRDCLPPERGCFLISQHQFGSGQDGDYLGLAMREYPESADATGGDDTSFITFYPADLEVYYAPMPILTNPVDGTDFSVGDSVTLSWSSSDSDCSYINYRLQLSRRSDFQIDSSFEEHTINGKSYNFTIPSLHEGERWYWRVQARNYQVDDLGDHSGTLSNANFGACSPFNNYRYFDIVAPPVNLDPPTGVSASDGTYSDYIKITWNSVANAYKYQVYRNTSDNFSTSSNLGYMPASSGTFWYDEVGDYNPPVYGQTYYYWIVTENANGDTSQESSSDSGYLAAPTVLSYIMVNGPSTVDENSETQYTCTAYYSDGSSFDVTDDAFWTIGWNNTGTNSYGTISNGKLTAYSVPSSVSCTITASYGDKSDSIDVVIEPIGTSVSGVVFGWGYRKLPNTNLSNLTKISAGHHNLALKSDGSIVGWGLNDYGQADVSAGNDFFAIVAGYLHSLAIKSDGSLVGWGLNSEGQTDVPSGNDFVAIAGGYEHSIALKSDGSLVAWGDNYYGQTSIPVGNDFVAIDSSYNHSLALRTDGSLVGWGSNYYGEATVPSGNDFIAIAAGYDHSLALRSDGSLVGWGKDTDGQATVSSGNDFIAIAAGYEHSLALRSDGSIVGWGRNNFGQINCPAGNDFVAISAGPGNCLALKADGTLTTWGTDLQGQTEFPVGNDYESIDAGFYCGLALKSDGSIVSWSENSSGTVPTGNNFTAIANGWGFSLALRSDGSLVGWGSNNEGQATVPDGEDFIKIAAGGFHSLALKSNGTLAAWGYNGYGETNVPSGNDFIAIAAGRNHSLALKSDGSLVGWGDDTDGQATVPSGNDFVAIDSSWFHNLALKSDGSIFAWGNNSSGQCNVPSPNSDFIAIAAGYGHSLALKADGNLVAWGDNYYGQATVPAGNAFIAISAGGHQSFALKATSTNFLNCDLIKDGIINLLDFAVLADQWLNAPGIPSADIAPVPDGDGVVDILDLQVLAENWLTEGATVQADFVANYNGSSPTIDGVLSAGEWSSSYTVTMDRRDGSGQHDIDLYFQQDGTYLFVGVDSQWGSGWDVVWDIAIDGDYSRTINGNLSQPYTDIQVCQQSPTGYPGYRAYYTLTDTGAVRVGFGSGADCASSGSTNVSYEFRVPLADLDVIPEASVGFTITHGYDGISEHLYEFVSRTTPENWATLQIVP